MSESRTELLNQMTQPPIVHKVFNNWQVVTEGWYIWGEAKRLARNSVQTRNIGAQKICVFRDDAGV